MDNKAYEKFTATQPVAPRLERVESSPTPELGTVEISVITVIVALAVYAVWHIIRDIVNKSSHKDKS